MSSHRPAPRAAKPAARHRAPWCPRQNAPPPRPSSSPRPRSYVGFGTAALMAFFIANGPDNTLQAWAKPIAEKELAEEDALFEAYTAVRARSRWGS